MSKTTAWADLVKMEAVPVVETDELLKLAKSRLEGQACIYCCRKFMAGSEMALPCGLRLEALLFPNPGACCLLPAALAALVTVSFQMGLRLSGPLCLRFAFLTLSTPKVTHLSSEGR